MHRSLTKTGESPDWFLDRMNRINRIRKTNEIDRMSGRAGHRCRTW